MGIFLQQLIAFSAPIPVWHFPAQHPLLSPCARHPPRLHAVSFGRQPSKPLILFLHGFPECWYSWRHLLPVLRNQYEVVALDMRGYGWSDKPQVRTLVTVMVVLAASDCTRV